jgi:hypothetical protein
VDESSDIFKPKGFEVDDKTKKAELAYQKPEVKDYGDLRELTSAVTPGPPGDVPKGTLIPTFS